MKIVESPVCYRDASELREVGYGDIAALLGAEGVPLEIVHVGHDRVLHIRTFDYEEGLKKPLVQRDTWWFDGLNRSAVEPVSVKGAMVVVRPDGSRFTWISR